MGSPVWDRTWEHLLLTTAGRFAVPGFVARCYVNGAVQDTSYS
jgi:hypothetical protein